MSEDTTPDESPLAYEVTINEPGTPEGAGVQIAGLGTFLNGTSTDITEAEHEAFMAYHTRNELVTNEDGSTEVVVVKGLPLHEAFPQGSTVEVATYAGGGN